jgi:hypothetical protein
MMALPMPSASAEPGIRAMQSMPDGVYGTNVGLPTDGNDVSCGGPAWCVSVLLGGPDAPSRESSTPDTLSGTWSTPVSLESPSGATGFVLLSISCPSVGNCLAVGFGFLTAGGQEPVVATETSGVWSNPVQLTAPTTPDPVAIPDARLDAVQCVSSGNCVVAGADYGAESAYLFTATLSAGTWTAPTLLSEPTNSKVANSVSVACASVYRCMIVASHGPGIIGWTTSAWTEASGTWGGPVQIAAKDQFLASGMACPSTQTCLVVGSTETPQHPAYMVKSGGVWSSPRQLPLPRLSPLASAGWLNEISCASASLCVAEGNLITTGAALGGVVSWSNGKWSSIGLFRGSTGSTELGGISCPTLSRCVVDGAASYFPPKSSTGENWFDVSGIVSPLRWVGHPGPPIGVRATTAGGEIQISWLPPTDDGGAPVQAYLAVTGGASAQCRSVVDDCVLRGLKPGRYRARVFAITGGGYSRPAYSGVIVVH